MSFYDLLESLCFHRNVPLLQKDQLVPLPYGYGCHDPEASAYRDWKVIDKDITLVSNDIRGMSIKIGNLAGSRAE